jgi:drug/metabolite transporter (DMT)-like permease
MLIFKFKDIKSYVTNVKNNKPILLAIVSIIIGTIIADALMWYSIQVSSRKTLPIAISLVHTAPLISLLLVVLVFKETLNWKAAIGIFITVIGCVVTIMNSGETVNEIS